MVRTSFEVLLVLLAGVTAGSGLARRTGVPAPFVLVVAGLAASFVPGVPAVELDPHLVLVLVLPPLLYAAALSTAYADFGDNLRPIALLSVGLVLVTTFAAFLPAEALHASEVLAVVVTGLYLGRRAPVLLSSGARLQGQALWGTITFLLEGLVFALIGLQLPQVLEALGDDSGEALRTAAAATATVMVVRLAYLFPAPYLPRRLSARERDPAPPWRYPFLIGWAGMRGVVSLAAAFALPADMPGRDLILFVTFCVILATLLVQGLSLPWLVRRLDLDDEGAVERTEKAVATADHHVTRVAMQELQRMDDEVPARVVEELRRHLEERVRHAHAVLGGCPGEDEYDDAATLEDHSALAEAASTAEVRRRLLDVERAELLRLYRERDIEDATLA